MAIQQEEIFSSSLPASTRNLGVSLTQLYQRKRSSLCVPHVLHPTKCRCLAESYSFLILDLLPKTLSLSSSSSSLQQRVLEALRDALLEGLCFLEDCTYKEGQQQQQWFVDKALSIALSSDIVDVHMHDLVWFMMVLVESSNVSLDLSLQAKRDICGMLRRIWSQADEEKDVESMKEFFAMVGAGRDEESFYLINFISQRLSVSTSLANPHEVLPEYLWVDRTRFARTDRVLGANSGVVVFETMWMGRRFASKEFFMNLSDEEGVTNEAAIQARLHHPNVVQLVCCTKSSSSTPSIGLVMELMHQNLFTLISDRMKAGMDAPFSLLEAVDLMLQIAKGMQYVHSLGIIHRDLKSLNILISSPCHANCPERRHHVRAKIADFGRSKVKQCISQYTTKRVGTGIWRAPEVLDDEDTKYTKKADVYSFAIICAEILTGLSPGELLPYKNQELHRKLLEGKRPKLPISCPAALASYIEKCWDGTPSKRPTFKQICTVFRWFKACILLGETEKMAVRFRDDINVEELHKDVHGIQSQHMFYHAVLNIPVEMHWMKLTLGCHSQAKKKKKNSNPAQDEGSSHGDASAAGTRTGSLNPRQQLEDSYARLLISDGAGEAWRKEFFQKVRILVLGRSGVGKTTLIRLMVGKDGPQRVSDGIAGVQNINEEFLYSSEEQGVPLIIHDSNGMDVRGKERVTEIKAFLDKHQKGDDFTERVHIVWYVISAIDPRCVDDGDVMQMISEYKIPLLLIMTHKDHDKKKVTDAVLDLLLQKAYAVDEDQRKFVKDQMVTVGNDGVSMGANNELVIDESKRDTKGLELVAKRTLRLMDKKLRYTWIAAQAVDVEGKLDESAGIIAGFARTALFTTLPRAIPFADPLKLTIIFYRLIVIMGRIWVVPPELSKALNETLLQKEASCRVLRRFGADMVYVTGLAITMLTLGTALPSVIVVLAATGVLHVGKAIPVLVKTFALQVLGTILYVKSAQVVSSKHRWKLGVSKEEYLKLCEEFAHNEQYQRSLVDFAKREHSTLDTAVRKRKVKGMIQSNIVKMYRRLLKDRPNSLNSLFSKEDAEAAPDQQQQVDDDDNDQQQQVVDDDTINGQNRMSISSEEEDDPDDELDKLEQESQIS